MPGTLRRRIETLDEGAAECAVLNVNSNRLERLEGTGVQRCARIHTLLCSCNHLQALPPALPRWFPCLRNLHVHDNRLRELPEALGGLASLQVLDVHGNAELRRLPRSLCGLSRLAKIIAGGCGLVELPPNIGRLPCLTHLTLRGNALARLPRSLGRCATLRALWLGNNPTLAFPGQPELRACGYSAAGLAAVQALLLAAPPGLVAEEEEEEEAGRAG